MKHMRHSKSPWVSNPSHRTSILVFFLCLLPISFQTWANEGDISQIRKGVIKITVMEQTPDYTVPWNPGRMSQKMGTGFIIQGNRILTNAHLASNARFLAVEKEGDSRRHEARVHFIAHDCDLAMLEVLDSTFFEGTVPLSIGGIPTLNSVVNVLGYPIGGMRLSITRGVVSRIDFQVYTHSMLDQHLAIQIDAAINPGNSGGPVLQGDRVVGVAFQGYRGDVAQNVGYMIPVPVIERFLNDISDGQYDRYVDLGIQVFPLLNGAHRRALGLGSGDYGVMVSHVYKEAPCENVLHVGDILLAIDGLTISSDGYVDMEGEKLHMAEVVERRLKGDEVRLDILRGDQHEEVIVSLSAPWPFQLQALQHDVRPRFVLFGGLVFQPLSRRFIMEADIRDVSIRYHFSHYLDNELYLDTPEIVVLSQVLPDPINVYLKPFVNGIVDTINGRRIGTLEDVADAFGGSPDYYVIRLKGNGRPLVLERKPSKRRENGFSKGMESFRRNTWGILLCRRIGRRRNRVSRPHDQNSEVSHNPDTTEKKELRNMLKRRTIILCLCLPLFFLGGCAAAPISRPNSAAQDPLVQSLIRVNVTRQNYSFHQPWQQGSPSSHTGIGVVMEGPRILLTSQMMANHRFVELEKLVTGEKGRAEVEVVDYEANLALVRPLDPDFLKDVRPLDFSFDAVEGDLLTVLQVKRNGNIVPSEGPITAIELLRYPSGSAFLAYRLNSSLQFRLNNFTLPVLKGGKLAGLLMGYDSKGQSVDVVAAPIIEHFLKEASDGDYQGFPNLGLKVVSMDDPQLRRYVGIPEDLDGLYVQGIQRGLGAEKAGLREGDIIIEIEGFTPDRHGDYEHPVYGRVSVSYLIRCEFYAGDRVQLKIFREGEVLEKEIVPEYIRPEDDPIPPFLADSPPRYFILGGLVLQELSLPYLREYGSDWSVKAPISLVYYQKNQYTLDLGEREKIVLLSRVLQTSRGMGYERLRDLVITEINDQPIRRLGDVPEALKFPINGFHKIEFEDLPRAIYVDPEELAGINQEIRQRYGLPALHNLDAY